MYVPDIPTVECHMKADFIGYPLLPPEDSMHLSVSESQ